MSDGIECGKIIIPKYTPDCRSFTDAINRIKDKISSKGHDFDQEFQLSPSSSTSPLKLKNQAKTSFPSEIPVKKLTQEKGMKSLTPK